MKNRPRTLSATFVRNVNGNRVEAAYRRTDMFDRHRVLMND